MRPIGYSPRMPTLHLSETLLAELRAHAEHAYPREACGLLLGRLEPREGKGPKLVAVSLHPAANVHAGSEDRFELRPQDLVSADAAAREAGLDIVGVYHSHPDAAAEPSEHDRRGAQAMWPSVIVEVRGAGAGGGADPPKPRAVSWRCWELAGEAFEEQKICVC